MSPEITEDDLRAAFGRFGSIENVNIIRPKSCAFVRFRSVPEAQNAHQSMQGAVIKGAQLVVGWGRPDPSARGDGGERRERNSYQSSGDYGASFPRRDRSDAHEHYGGARYVEVRPDDPDSSLTSKRIPMKELPVKNPARTLWVGNVQDDFTEDYIRQLFAPFGAIVNIRMMLNKVCA